MHTADVICRDGARDLSLERSDAPPEDYVGLLAPRSYVVSGFAFRGYYRSLLAVLRLNLDMRHLIGLGRFLGSGGPEYYGSRTRVCWAHRRYGRAWSRDVGDSAGVS